MQFTIFLEPRPQKRARSRAINSNGRTYAMTYKDKGQRQEEKKLMALLYEQRPPYPLAGPLRLGVKAFLSLPQSKSKKWKLAAVYGEIRPTTKPDLDNLLKQFKDCCKGIFWEDDKQVVEYLPGTGKYYGYPARWEIIIEEIVPDQKETTAPAQDACPWPLAPAALVQVQAAYTKPLPCPLAPHHGHLVQPFCVSTASKEGFDRHDR